MILISLILFFLFFLFSFGQRVPGSIFLQKILLESIKANFAAFEILLAMTFFRDFDEHPKKPPPDPALSLLRVLFNTDLTISYSPSLSHP